MYTKETSFSRRMKQAEQHAASLLQQILIFVLIFLVIFMMVQIQNLHGTAHVVNYASLVRGATQREVKLEITGTANDMQIEYLDKILSGLKYEDGNYNLVSLKDSAYQQCLDNQIEYWELLKEEIYTVREKGYENTNVVSMSETYFEYADETVTAAEQYSEKIAARIRLTEIISALDILLLIFLIVQQQIQHIQAVRENHILSKKAYLDVHTGLPNKSRCEDLLNSSGFITEPLCFVMFDLNNLKEVNDTLGHAAGDSMIANFASYDRYPWEYTFFPVGGDVILIEDDRLAEALNALPQDGRDILLMYFFLDMADREIAERMNMARRTVNARRQKAYRLLKELMGGDVDD